MELEINLVPEELLLQAQGWLMVWHPYPCLLAWVTSMLYSRQKKVHQSNIGTQELSLQHLSSLSAWKEWGWRPSLFLWWFPSTLQHFPWTPVQYETCHQHVQRTLIVFFLSLPSEAGSPTSEACKLVRQVPKITIDLNKHISRFNLE